jgi:ammonium transporter, Amt family
LLTLYTGYGFNPGSALVIANEDSAAAAALAAVTTTMGGASGCVSAMFTDSILESMISGEVSYDLTMAMNGALGGLVAVTAGTAVIAPWAAIIVGIIGGWSYIAMSKLLQKLKIDDAVDAVPVSLSNRCHRVLRL